MGTVFQLELTPIADAAGTHDWIQFGTVLYPLGSGLDGLRGPLHAMLQNRAAAARVPPAYGAVAQVHPRAQDAEARERTTVLAELQAKLAIAQPGCDFAPDDLWADYLHQAEVAPFVDGMFLEFVVRRLYASRMSCAVPQLVPVVRDTLVAVGRLVEHTTDGDYLVAHQQRERQRLYAHLMHGFGSGLHALCVAILNQVHEYARQAVPPQTGVTSLDGLLLCAALTAEFPGHAAASTSSGFRAFAHCLDRWPVLMSTTRVPEPFSGVFRVCFTRRMALGMQTPDPLLNEDI